MQIWLDTINLDVVKGAACLISGVTTNPSILSQTRNVKSTLKSLLEVQKGLVAVQVTSHDTQGMIEEGKSIFEFSDRMVVKVPVSSAGLKAIYELKKLHIPVLATAIFQPSQAIFCANLKADYITPYFSHIEGNAKDVVASIRAILNSEQISSKLLVASVKTISDFEYLAQIGVDAITIKDDLYAKLISSHPLLEKCTLKFDADWFQAHGNLSIKDLLLRK